MKKTKDDIHETPGNLQVRAIHHAGGDAAVQAMISRCSWEECEAVFLADYFIFLPSFFIFKQQEKNILFHNIQIKAQYNNGI